MIFLRRRRRRHDTINAIQSINLADDVQPSRFHNFGEVILLSRIEMIGALLVFLLRLIIICNGYTVCLEIN